MPQLTKAYLIFSALFVVACAVDRPNTDLCGVNAPAGLMRCYNLKNDYDDNGQRKPDAVPTERPARVVGDLHAYTCTDPDGLGELKAYIKKLRNEYQRCQAERVK